MTPTHILLYIFIDLCCLAVGILVIYSIFNISVTARISEFGQMQTIGMTSRQIRRFVSWEALIETAVGTVLGIFLQLSFRGPLPVTGHGAIWASLQCSFLSAHWALLCFSEKTGQKSRRYFTVKRLYTD